MTTCGDPLRFRGATRIWRTLTRHTLVYRGTLLIRTPPSSYDPTVDVCLGSYGGPGGWAVSYERGTPVHVGAHNGHGDFSSKSWWSKKTFTNLLAAKETFHRREASGVLSGGFANVVVAHKYLLRSLVKQEIRRSFGRYEN